MEYQATHHADDNQVCPRFPVPSTLAAAGFCHRASPHFPERYCPRGAAMANFQLHVSDLARLVETKDDHMQQGQHRPFRLLGLCSERSRPACHAGRWLPLPNCHGVAARSTEKGSDASVASRLRKLLRCSGSSASARSCVIAGNRRVSSAQASAPYRVAASATRRGAR